jgi:hypothetical protein
MGREDLLALDVRSRTYGWPLETVVKAARAGLRVREVAVDARPRAGGESKVSGSALASAKAGLQFAGVFARDGFSWSPPDRAAARSGSADVEGRVVPLGVGVGGGEQGTDGGVEGKPLPGQEEVGVEPPGVDGGGEGAPEGTVGGQRQLGE